MSEATLNITNRAVENAAIAFVLAWEASQGRPSRDTRHQGAEGDITNAERTIEVKAYGRSARGQELWLEPRQYHAAVTDPRFWLYIVENVRQGDPAHFRLLTIGGHDLHTLLARAVERRYYAIPWPVASYDHLLRKQHPAPDLAPPPPSA